MLLAMSALVAPAHAVVWTVGPEGAHPTLASALAVAAPGDRLELAPGDYPESVTVSFDLEIVGTGGSAATTLGAAGAEAAVTVAGGTLTLTGVTLAPVADRGVDVLEGAGLVGDDLVVSDHQGELDGPAIRVRRGTLALTDSVFERNVGGTGGSLSLVQSTATIESCTFADGAAAEGGTAIHATDGTLVLRDTTFSGHSGDEYALGAVAGLDVGLEVDGCTFDGNTSGDWSPSAGALFVERGSVVLRGSSFTGNSGGFHGAVNVEDADLLVTDSVFSANTAPWHAGALSFFAYAAAPRSLEVAHSEFYDNVAEWYYGAVGLICSGPCVVRDSTFVGNSSDASGALEVFVGDGWRAEVLDNVFTDNTATNGGGGVTIRGGGALIRGNEFTRNIGTPNGVGGGLVLFITDSPEVIGNTFCANEAAVGGALYHHGATTESIFIANNVFVENVADGVAVSLTSPMGGAIGTVEVFPSAVPMTLENNTFVANTVTSSWGGQVGTENRPLAMRNNLFAHAGAGHGVWQAPAGGERDYDLWFDNAPAHLGGALGPADLGANAVVGVDPLFHAYSADGDCSNDLLALQPLSPAIDAGDPALLDPDGSISDIGAYGGPDALTFEGVDLDLDGYYDGYSDCDDTNPDVNAGAIEVCGNGVDDDCEGTADGPDAVDALAFYPDADGDGRGADDASVTLGCVVPDGHVEVQGDCDDLDPTVHVGQVEVCDGRDDDCDGQVDEDLLSTWFPDGDGDGVGVAPETSGCTAPEDAADVAGDCDDADPESFPGASEVPDDGVDQDCDGEDATTAEKGCGCGAAPGFGAGWLLALVGTLARRRRP